MNSQRFKPQDRCTETADDSSTLSLSSYMNDSRDPRPPYSAVTDIPAAAGLWARVSADRPCAMAPGGSSRVVQGLAGSPALQYRTSQLLARFPSVFGPWPLMRVPNRAAACLKVSLTTRQRAAKKCGALQI